MNELSWKLSQNDIRVKLNIQTNMQTKYARYIGYTGKNQRQICVFI